MEKGADTSLTHLVMKWSRACKQGRGLKLSLAELDALNAVGVGALISKHAAAEQRVLAADRIRQRAESKQERAPSPGETLAKERPVVAASTVKREDRKRR